MELNERQQLILQAVVHSYITTAEPVGSRTVVKRFDLDLSAATVRNVMGDLEEAGYLQQPHTSSGRVPTDRGYRYYVDYLMRIQAPTTFEQQRILSQLSEDLTDAEELMRQASRLLAAMSHQTSFVESPDELIAQVRHMELVSLGGKRMGAMIADSFGRVRTSLVTLDDEIRPEVLANLSRFLNDNFQGVPIRDLSESIQVGMSQWFDEQKSMAEQTLELLQLLPIPRTSQVFVEGATQLFEQPEFRDVDRAREVFILLNERQRLMELLRGGLFGDKGASGAAILIGSETHEEGMEELSLVASPYRVGNENVGMLGVLGPRRMPYSRLSALVDYTAEHVSRLLTRLAS